MHSCEQSAEVKIRQSWQKQTPHSAKLAEQRQAIDERLASFDSELAGVDDQLREAERWQQQLVKPPSVLNRRSGTGNSESCETETRLVRLRLSARERSVVLHRSIESGPRLSANWTSSTKTLSPRQQAVDQHETRITELKSAFDSNKVQIDQAQKSRTELTAEASHIRQKIALLEAQIRSLEETRDQHQDELTRLNEELESATTELESRQEAVEEALEQAAKISELWAQQRVVAAHRRRRTETRKSSSNS